MPWKIKISCSIYRNLINKSPHWIKNEFDIPQQYVEFVKSKGKKLFYLEPSVGLGGYIVATELVPEVGTIY